MRGTYPYRCIIQQNFAAVKSKTTFLSVFSNLDHDQLTGIEEARHERDGIDHAAGDDQTLLMHTRGVFGEKGLVGSIHTATEYPPLTTVLMPRTNCKGVSLKVWPKEPEVKDAVPHLSVSVTSSLEKNTPLLSPAKSIPVFSSTPKLLIYS